MMVAEADIHHHFSRHQVRQPHLDGLIFLEASLAEEGLFDNQFSCRGKGECLPN
jgi:hypothetical protein